MNKFLPIIHLKGMTCNKKEIKDLNYKLNILINCQMKLFIQFYFRKNFLEVQRKEDFFVNIKIYDLQNTNLSCCCKQIHKLC